MFRKRMISHALCLFSGNPSVCLSVCLSVHSAAYGLIVKPNDFASYLLAIAICNLLLYFAFYIIMKVTVCVCVCLCVSVYVCVCVYS